ncbi:hypothetical protein WMF28_31790 [Sorangium sp. So ce590]|uniref:hypothetical protein n=1 Tax=Sorangium sp. So ce590 TaxID=3133317 RepID=UPI003F63AEE1
MVRNRRAGAAAASCAIAECRAGQAGCTIRPHCRRSSAEQKQLPRAAFQTKPQLAMPSTSAVAPRGRRYDWPATSGTSPLGIRGIAFDPSGNLGMTGYTASDVDMGGGVLRSGGTDDALLAKYDAAGNHTISKLFGDDSIPQAGNHIAFDADCNMFLVRRHVTSSWFDMFLDKVDSAGNPLWSERLNAGHEADWHISSIAVDPTTGSVVFTGRYYGDFDLGGGLLPRSESDYDPTSGYVAKFDAMGHFVWSKFSPRRSGRYMPGAIMAVDPSGQIVIAADDSDIVDDGSGKFARFLLARLDALGNPLWNQEWTAPVHDRSASSFNECLAGIAVDGDGSVILAGNAPGLRTRRCAPPT